MSAGHYISGVGHAGLIGWLLLGDAFAPSPEPFEVTEVAVISTEEFEQIMGAVTPPETVSEAPTPPVITPPEEIEPLPVAQPAPDPEPQPRPEQPVVEPAAPPDDSPDVTQIVAPPPTEVEDTPPEITPPAEEVVLAPKQSLRPKPRPVPRVAPEPVAQPEPDTRPDDVVREEVRKDDAGEVQKEEAEATAPEEAAKEIVTEADEPASAPKRSLRPKARPTRPQTNEPQDDFRSAIEQAVAEANETPSQPAAPSGPPLTAGEKDTLRVSVQRCWNTGSLSSEALRTTVVVAVSMSEEGKPDIGSIRMVSSNGGSDSSSRQAFEAARRAIIRCGASGYNLPKEKYAQWRDIEMTFNPEKMRIK
ncbi:MAG: energy transducer TonB [Thalassovita sp.]